MVGRLGVLYIMPKNYACAAGATGEKRIPTAVAGAAGAKTLNQIPDKKKVELLTVNCFFTVPRYIGIGICLA